MSTPRRAAIYVRISQDRNGGHLGVSRQKEDCEALAERLGINVVHVYVDNDVSAFSEKPRPQYQELLEDIRSRKIDVVLAWHTDRLHRKTREQLDYIELSRKYDLATHTVTSGDLDLSTPTGRAAAITIGAWAAAESERGAERIKRKILQKAQNGEYHGGVERPFGFESDGIRHRDDEAEEIRKMTRAVIAGESIASIIRDLNSRGITSVRGNPWTYSTVRAMLLRVRNAGLRQYRGEVIGKAAWDPIVSPSEFDVLRRILNDPARRTTKESARKHLLSGVAKCGVCGKGMKSGGSKTRGGTPFKVYRCCVTRNMPKLDAHVEQVTNAILQNQPWQIGDIATVDTNQIQAEIAQIEFEMVENARERAAGRLTLSQLLAQNEIYEPRLVALHQKLIDCSPTTWDVWVGTPDSKDFFSLSTERRRTIIQSLLQIRVMPAGQATNARGATIADHVDIAFRGDFAHEWQDWPTMMMAARLNATQKRVVLRAFEDTTVNDHSRPRS